MFGVVNEEVKCDRKKIEVVGEVRSRTYKTQMPAIAFLYNQKF